MIELNKPFKLFANCVPVRGFNRSTICDLQRQYVKLIPNDLQNILANYQGQSIKEIKKHFKNKYDHTIEEYFHFLFEEEFIFFTDQPSNFPDLSREWDSPSIISNAILDFDNKSNYNWRKFITELNFLHCNNLEIRFFCEDFEKTLTSILSFIEKSNITSISAMAPYNCEENYIELFDNQRLCSLMMHSSPTDELLPLSQEKRRYIVYSTESLKDHSHCGIISTNNFVINTSLFTESLNYNTCLNRKVSLDVKGNIKNCPSMKSSFGNIRDTSISSVLKNHDFTKYWNIKKDDINICKDCEFRHICSDCRAYTQNQNDLNSKPLKCGYNPYKNTWEDWSENNLKKYN